MWLLFSELGDSEDRETGKDQTPGVNSSQVHCSLESVAVEGAGWGARIHIYHKPQGMQWC